MYLGSAWAFGCYLNIFDPAAEDFPFSWSWFRLFRKPTPRMQTTYFGACREGRLHRAEPASRSDLRFGDIPSVTRIWRPFIETSSHRCHESLELPDRFPILVFLVFLFFGGPSSRLPAAGRFRHVDFPGVASQVTSGHAGIIRIF